MAELSSQTLHIVARELNAELNEARAALELFGDQQDNLALLRRCNEHLHAVHGALRVSEVYGAALLAEEMGQVLHYLVDNFAEKRHLAEGLDALMRSMVQLPTYLERVLSGGRDMALVLLPLLNDLRAVRGDALLSEGTLLLLNLSSDQQASPASATSGEGAASVAQWARKLRTRFQLGLLGWIKGERVDQNLEVLARAAERLEQVATTQPVFQLWWVVGALIEAMREGGLEGSASVKRLLGQADRDMRRLYEQGESRYADAPSLELLNNMLYYVARAKSSGPRVSAVRASFRLSELLPVDDQVEQARESLSAPSVKLMKTVAAAIKEDLGRVKDALDLFVRRGGTQVEELAPQLELLKKIGDTLGVLGLGELRDKVQGETAELQAIIAQQAPVNDNVLLRMASTLIKVEDSLDEQLVGMIVPSGEPSAPAKPASPDDIEFRQVTEAVLRECIVNMARIKEAIAQSMDRTREGQTIDQIPALVRGITAGLLMLGKTRAAEIMEGIDKALSQFVRSDGMTLPPDAVDRLADGIVAVEYYMETIQAGRTDPWYMLDNAEACLEYLSETQPVPIGEAFPAATDHAHTVVLEPLSQTVAAPTEQERTAVLDRVPQLTPVPRPAPAPVAAAPQAPAVVPPAMVRPTDRDIDPEFLELFIEEAKDEIARLEKFFPMWDQNPQDLDSLVNVRRSFHTLKGSGRMVGAQLIGEFAWSIETLLNRVINKTLDRTPDIMGVMRSAIAAVPQLVEQLETGRAPVADIGLLMTQANNLSGARPQAPASAAAPAPAAAHQPARAAPTLTSIPPAQKKTVVPAMDPVLHDIYGKETLGHLAAIRKFIADCRQATPPYLVTEDLHRSCHTLSGTAKTAGAVNGTTVADPLNRYVRKLYDNSAGLSDNGLDVLKDAVAAIQQGVDHINEDASFFGNHAGIVVRLHELEAELDQDIARLGETMDVGAEATRAIPVLRNVELPSLAHSVPTLEDTHEVLMEDPDAATNVFVDADFPAVGVRREAPAVDEPVTQPVEEESEEITIDSVDLVEMPSTDASDMEALEWSYKNFPADEPTVTTPSLDDPDTGREVEEISYAASLDEGDGIVVEETVVSAAVAPAEPDNGFVVEDFDGLAQTNRVPVLAMVHETSPPVDEALAAAIHEGMVGEEIVIEVGEIPLDTADAGSVPHFVDDSETVQSIALSVVAPPEPEPAPDFASQPEPAPLAEQWFAPAPDVAISADIEPEQAPLAPPVVVPAPAMDAPPAALLPAAVEPDEPELDENFDPDVAAIFTEEAAELLETADSSLSAWSRDRANKALVFELKRVLHTLKGGARMAGIRAMGDLSHELETLMELVEAGQVAGDQPVFDVLQTSLDTLHRMRDTVNQGGRCASPRELISRIRALSGQEQAAPAPVQPEPVAAAVPEISAPAPDVEMAATEAAVADAAPIIDELAPAGIVADESMEIEVEFGADELGAAAAREAVRIDAQAAMPVSQAATFDVAAVTPELLPEAPVAGEPELIPAPALPPGREPHIQERQEFARVDADLLDTLLNNAGEVSIFRSRLEQQVGSIEFNLAELGRTVTRLKDQLRKLELETEAQILHRRQEEQPNRSDFDPLELDRYSTIQQLTRAFAESVSDVGSIEGLLENLTREGQNLLLQQARVVTELQNGLMRTRMVPFQRHVQRLSRLVRQVATDVGKKAELVVVGAAGELDRQVLDRMLPPFEHMLRNSIVHGIETPEERVAKGKPESGTIRVGLHREGAEMVIILEDDGRGIDVNAVRERARLRGLLQPGRVLTDEEAMQLILEPGFSTASTVTQHAGRGVGMDVVVTEIKKLGGALFTESQPGQGVKFTIRLPFTLAITQALIVRTGDELYALPLPSVEGVARVPRSEVEKHLAEETPTFNYGGQIYRFQHLGAFVGGGASTLPDGDVSVPLILIRAGEHSTAIVPDELVGSREMVVKSVGPQIATIRGISGATIMGDGRIVIILDMGALVRSEWRGRGHVEGPREDRRTFALVVDDSITVRRVTQRLLERNGMRVMTAKDGVDALSIIQEHLPDVILLDIEMPRMDGYEFATHVRADSRTADIPIVMITSRTGEKHRARAIEIGVNDYLGKPYQENQLLDAIEPLVEARRRHRRMA
ncbi:Hpt domain-containing protein [Povalibacter sp.]|uniref:Hpt domain-containing protein n=1 Tax=Povalibacter sp. TaxID=1962978 RepID=UPI002F40B452